MNGARSLTLAPRPEGESVAAVGLPRPLYITEEQLAMIEGWASNAATHGNLEAWGVLSQCLLWRTSA